MRKLLISLTLFAYIGNAQVDTANVSAIINAKGHGQGDNTFSVTLPKLEKLYHADLNTLEKQLGEWSYETVYEMDYLDEVTNRKLPGKQITYDAECKGKRFWVRTELRGDNKKGHIHTIEFIIVIGGTQLADLKNDLRSSGYYLNENLSHMLGKECWQHKKKTITVTIKRNPKGNYSIGF